MKILIVSDTHRKHQALEEVLKKVGPIDRMIHLGDSEGCEDYIEALAGCPVEIVAGNNDFFSYLDREKEIQIGKYKIFLSHGHYYYVSVNKETIIQEAKSRGCNVVMFGHTHVPYLHQEDGFTALNPGSLSYPRQEGRRPSYIIMEMDGDGEAHYTINYL